MPSVDLEKSLSVEFFSLTATGSYREDYGPPVTGPVFIGNEMDRSRIRSESINYAIFRDLFQTKKEAYDLIDWIRSNETSLSERSVDTNEIKCVTFRAEFYPVVFDPTEYDALRYSGACDSMDRGIKSQVNRVFGNKYPEFNSPETPVLKTDDGNSPVFRAHTRMTINQEDWHEAIKINSEQGIKAFSAYLFSKASPYRCVFQRVAEEIGKEMLLSEGSKPKIILESRFFSFYETSPGFSLTIEPEVQKENLRQQLLNINPEDNPLLAASQKYLVQKLEM